MARPVKIRTARGYAREIEQLIRLRTSIVLDDCILEVDRDSISIDIDTLVKKLRLYADAG